MTTVFYLEALLEFIATAADAFNLRHVTKDSVSHIDKSKHLESLLLLFICI